MTPAGDPSDTSVLLSLRRGIVALCWLALMPQSLWLAAHALAEHGHGIEACPQSAVLEHGHTHEDGTPDHQHWLAASSGVRPAGAVLAGASWAPPAAGAPGPAGALGPAAALCAGVLPAVTATESPPGLAPPSLARLCVFRI